VREKFGTFRGISMKATLLLVVSLLFIVAGVREASAQTCPSAYYLAVDGKCWSNSYLRAYGGTGVYGGEGSSGYGGTGAYGGEGSSSFSAVQGWSGYYGGAGGGGVGGYGGLCVGLAGCPTIPPPPPR
jgi:hypothetical protein